MTGRRQFYKRYIKNIQLESRGSSEDDPSSSEEDDSDLDPAWDPTDLNDRRSTSIGPHPRKKTRFEQPGCSRITFGIDHDVMEQERPGDVVLEEGRPGDVVEEGRPGNVVEEGRSGDVVEEGRSGDEVLDEGRPGDEVLDEGRPGDVVLEEGRPGDEVLDEGRPGDVVEEGRPGDRQILQEAPENFILEGSLREEPLPQRRRKENRQKTRKVNRNKGLPYTQEKSMNLVGPRCMKERCRGDPCERAKRTCKQFSEEERKAIFTDYWNLGNVDIQRQFIARHVTAANKKKQTVPGNNSRRQKTNTYTLMKDGKKETVCKQFFLNTLNISETVVKTTMSKIQNTGVVEVEQRGGRSTTNAARDEATRTLMLAHINRFPRVESHYCRADTTREYLHPDLSINKMFEMYKQDNPELHIGSRETYRKLFDSLNLSFHCPKKDQCTLCVTFKTGDESTKNRLKESYEKHTAEKTNVRRLKTELKEEAVLDRTKACLVFDLQQVIYLPRTNENAVFYKRRLSTFNFTVYDTVTKDCICYTWNETISKRGACEIASCLYQTIKTYDQRGFVTINFFSDGCGGQNKNSMVAAMFMYALHNSLNVKEITLKFFETNHGQNEGDSAHSAISQAINKAGDLFIPSQLAPIISLARRRQPYLVRPLETQDFLDFKEISKELKLLETRKDNESDNPICWPNMAQWKFRKETPNIMYFKRSHFLEPDYKSLTVGKNRRTRVNTDEILKRPLKNLNDVPPKLSIDKFNDLTSLCDGPLPVIRGEEFVRYYKSLSH